MEEQQAGTYDDGRNWRERERERDVLLHGGRRRRWSAGFMGRPGAEGRRMGDSPLRINSVKESRRQ
jgi:hypothetical protein